MVLNMNYSKALYKWYQYKKDSDGKKFFFKDHDRLSINTVNFNNHTYTLLINNTSSPIQFTQNDKSYFMNSKVVVLDNVLQYDSIIIHDLNKPVLYELSSEINNNNFVRYTTANIDIFSDDINLSDREDYLYMIQVSDQYIEKLKNDNTNVIVTYRESLAMNTIRNANLVDNMLYCTEISFAILCLARLVETTKDLDKINREVELDETQNEIISMVNTLDLEYTKKILNFINQMKG